MANWMSLKVIALQDRQYTRSFRRAGLKPTKMKLGEGTVIHGWVPMSPNPNRPNLVLLHGLGANAIRQWHDYVLSLSSKFNVYAPDLVFFGESYTAGHERSEAFQAQCVMKMLEAHMVRRMQVVGLSYGGFVGYCMAAKFPDMVDRLVLVASAVSMEDKDVDEGLFLVKNLDEATSILLPRKTYQVKALLRQTCYNPPKMYLPLFINIIIELMCSQFHQQRKELIEALFNGRKLSELPIINQPTLIIWGESDQMFPLELAHRLKSHLCGKALLVTIKKAGHAIKMEKPEDLFRYIDCFLKS